MLIKNINEEISPPSSSGEEEFDSLSCEMLDMEKIKCKYCEKIIEGHTLNQVEYMMKQHLISKHLDKIEIKEIKGGKDERKN